MARKHKKGDGPTPPPVGSGVDPDLALFASYVRDEEQREREEKKAAREARRQADTDRQLVAAKDTAAAEVKRLRGREGVSAEQRATADATYRDALAAVVAAETGSVPAWAPPAEPEDAGEAGEEPGPDSAPDDSDGADTEPPTG
ncbi:MAG: hypothetical protein H0U29_09860, partial [Acidimicrobiia bacterium]|nr:hypothetical protein [Acidimicrobiia bacterium]